MIHKYALITGEKNDCGDGGGGTLLKWCECKYEHKLDWNNSAKTAISFLFKKAFFFFFSLLLICLLEKNERDLAFMQKWLGSDKQIGYKEMLNFKQTQASGDKMDE